MSNVGARAVAAASAALAAAAAAAAGGGAAAGAAAPGHALVQAARGVSPPAAACSLLQGLSGLNDELRILSGVAKC